MKKLKLNLIMMGVTVLGLGALTSCGGAGKKYVNDAIGRLNYLSGEFTSVRGQIETPATITVIDDKDASIRKTVTISWDVDQTLWSITTDTNANATYLTPNLPGADEDPVPFTVTAIAQCEGAKAKKSFTGELQPTAVTQADPVSNVYSGLVGETITVRGVARDARSGSGFVVCDSTGCTYVYDRGANSVVPGHTIEVTGEIAENAKTINAKEELGIVGGTVGCRQIANVSTVNVVNAIVQNTIPQGDHIRNITIEEHKNFVKDPGAADFVNHVGEVYKCRGYLYRYSQSYGDTFELIPAIGTTSPYLSFYANTSNADVNAGLDGFYGALENQYVEATFMVYDISQSSKSGSVSWRNVCLDIVAVTAA